MNIAARLGLPKDILAVARDLHGVASAQLSEVLEFSIVNYICVR